MAQICSGVYAKQEYIKHSFNAKQTVLFSSQLEDMNTSVLLKIPLLISLLFGMHVTLTSPQPTPNFEELIVGQTGWEVVLAALLKARHS